MAKQIKNRREDLYINDVPPEILDKATLSADGFVTNTDYPTSSVAGVIKLSSNRAVGHVNGTLQATGVTMENYPSLSNNAFISKGTLENVFSGLIQQYIKAIFLANVMEPDTTKSYAVTMEYNSVTQEWGFDFQAL